MLKKISVVAVPSILQQSFISVGNMFIQGLVNSFGSPGDCGLQRGSEAQYLHDYLVYDAGKRTFQLHGPEHRSRAGGTGEERV